MSGTRPDTILSVRLPTSTVRALRARAKAEGGTVSEVLRRILSAGLPVAGTVEAEIRALRDEVAALRRVIEGR